MKIISFYGGPGTGKSSTAAFLFFLMKIQNFRCELVPEYAKDITYEEAVQKFRNQDYISSKQFQRIERVANHVEWAVTDSPLFLGLAYADREAKEFPSFEAHILARHNKYEQYNFFLGRRKQYQQYGRYQTRDEAVEKDKFIRENLIKYNVPFTDIECYPDAAIKVLNVLGLGRDLSPVAAALRATFEELFKEDTTTGYSRPSESELSDDKFMAKYSQP